MLKAEVKTSHSGEMMKNGEIKREIKWKLK